MRRSKRGILRYLERISGDEIKGKIEVKKRDLT